MNRRIHNSSYLEENEATNNISSQQISHITEHTHNVKLTTNAAIIEINNN